MRESPTKRLGGRARGSNGESPESLSRSLAQYGARLRTIDGRLTVELVDPNDRSRSRYQYQRRNGTVWRRVLTADGETITDWTALTADELAQLVRTRGDYHPILGPLGL